jgi:hypothetical protein
MLREDQMTGERKIDIEAELEATSLEYARFLFAAEFASLVNVYPVLRSGQRRARARITAVRRGRCYAPMSCEARQGRPPRPAVDTH